MKSYLFVGIVTLLQCAASATSQAADMRFVNNTGKTVNYRIYHSKSNLIASQDKIYNNEKYTHNNLSGLGERALVVWDSNGNLIFAGRAGVLTQNKMLVITLRIKNNGDGITPFEYVVD
tara:strand:- start:471 stop:827 length:357 start_codon:yes stop_codon:yes gene_type:complete